MMDLGLAGALVGGLLTLLSPCSVMLLPAFFAYAFTSPGRLLARTGVFYLGLVTTLVPLGVLAGTLGAVVVANRVLLTTIVSGIVIALGLVQLLGIPLRWPAAGRSTDGSGLSVYLLGTIYGFAGVCALPLLGAVLTLGAYGGNALYGGLVLLVYAIGMVLPLAVLALLWGRFDRLRGWLRPRRLVIGRWSNTWTQVIGGTLVIGVGALLIITEGTSSLPGLLGAPQQAALESEAITATASVPDLVLATSAFVVLAAVVVVRRVLDARRREE